MSHQNDFKVHVQKLCKQNLNIVIPVQKSPSY